MYLSGVPERLIAKFRNNYVGIILRMRRALDGRGSHSFTYYRQLGERLTNIALVIFAIGLNPALQRNVVPFANLAQDIGALPWERYLALRCICEVELVLDIESLRWLSTLLRLYLLLFLTWLSSTC